MCIGLALLSSASCRCRTAPTGVPVPAQNIHNAGPHAADASELPHEAPTPLVPSDASPVRAAVVLHPGDDAVLASLATMPGSAVLRPARRMANDTQWLATSCAPAATAYGLAAEQLHSQGWTLQASREHDGINEGEANGVQTLTAERDGLTASIVVAPSKRADCTGATVSFTAFRGY